jgi:ATP-dependent Clp protease protease subunit
MKKTLDFESSHILSGNIDESNVETAMRWIIDLNNKGVDSLVTLYINSEGGSVNDAFALADMIRISKTPIGTVALGSLMSSAFLIFSSGFTSSRGVSKNTSIMMHQFNHEYNGKYHDMKSYAKELDRINDRMIELIHINSNLTEDDVKRIIVTPTDSWFAANELVNYGIADYIF